MNALPFRPNELPPNVEVDFLDGYEWRWLCEEKERWLTNFVIDIKVDGVRYVLVKPNMLMVHGVTGNKCDDALKRFKEIIDHERKYPNPNTEVREVARIKVNAPNIRRFKVDEKSDERFKEYWDENRSWHDKDSKLIKTAFSSVFERRPTRYRQMSIFDFFGETT